jgi:hypothetical protein
MAIKPNFGWKQRSDYEPGKSRLSAPSRLDDGGLPKGASMPGNSTVASGFDFPAQKGSKGAKLPQPPNVYEKEPPVRD